MRQKLITFVTGLLVFCLCDLISLGLAARDFVAVTCAAVVSATAALGGYAGAVAAERAFRLS